MRHAVSVLIGAAAAAGLIVGPLAATAGAQPVSASIALVQGDPVPGETIAFVNTFASGTKNPGDEVNCYQNGTWVYGELLSVTQESQYGFQLPSMDMSCVADLVSVSFTKGGEKVTSLAQTSFLVF